MAIMASGDIIAGSSPSAEKPKEKTKTVIAKGSADGASMRRAETNPGAPERHCGAMSQQRSDSSAISTPQKLLHLVGCRDSKAHKTKPGAR
jgi:hypothetical protein